MDRIFLLLDLLLGFTKHLQLSIKVRHSLPDRSVLFRGVAEVVGKFFDLRVLKGELGNVGFVLLPEECHGPHESENKKPESSARIEFDSRQSEHQVLFP